MQKRHSNRIQYFEEQNITSKKYVFPLINGIKPINTKTSVLEIGCGEGGNLKPFLDSGCERILGIDLSKKKIDNANFYFSKHINVNSIEFIHDNIFNIDITEKFDIILTRDVIEHIHDQEKFMVFIKKILKPDGIVFLGFPPWLNPFGGHQQMCESKFLSKLPFFHIFPFFIYKFILKAFGESDTKIKGLLEVKETGITVERFEKILKATRYKRNKRVFYFINPHYEVKFGLQPRKLNPLVSIIPFFRNFFTTSIYYVISSD